MKQKFLPENLVITTWNDLRPFADQLEAREINSVTALEGLLADWSEFLIVAVEDYYWRMIKTTLYTNDDAIKKSYDDFLNDVQPEWSKWEDRMKRRVLASACVDQIAQKGFGQQLKRWREETALFRDANIPLHTEDGMKCLKAGQIKGGMTVEMGGKTLTFPEAVELFESSDRNVREEAWRKTRIRMLEDKQPMDDSISELVPLRHQIALNAGFKNYRDYKFKELQRFDYTPQDCFTFHDAIEKEIVPLVAELQRNEAKMMGVEKLRPWDSKADPLGRPALKAFQSADELIEKGIAALTATDADFGKTISNMKSKNCLDLASRPNKAPGGYNVGLPVTGASFMFANVTGTGGDLAVFIHEAGHAVHDYLQLAQPLYFDRSPPMEMAELASMAMELLSFDQWHRFFPKEDECNRAQYAHLKDIVGFFPYMACVDGFQHALYEKPEMTPEERHAVFANLTQRFDTGMVDWSGIEHLRDAYWHRQGHIFEMPFYYIEYGIAQLGALQVWRNYKQDKKQAIGMYKDALALGSTKGLPELYKTAGVKLDFSQTMLRELMGFVQKEMVALV